MYDLIVFFVTFIFGTLWMLDRHLKSQPEYKTAVQLPGPPMYPIVGNLFEVLFMNGGKFVRCYNNSANHWKLEIIRQHFQNTFSLRGLDFFLREFGWFFATFIILSSQ